jgi:hypothetical protein
MTQLEQPPFAAEAMSAIVRVGDGRGFVIAHKRRQRGYSFRHDRIEVGVVSCPIVVTAAHCLPHLPIVHGEPGWGDWDSTTYKNLLAPLGCKPTVWAECVFADPVGDIAVLGQPDNQALGEQADAFDALLESVKPLKIAAPGKEGWLLLLEGVWFRCAVKMICSPVLGLTAMEGNLAAGMSGSPIISPEGRAIGVACLGSEISGRPTEFIGPNPWLAGNLPGWVLGWKQRRGGAGFANRRGK